MPSDCVLVSPAGGFPAYPSLAYASGMPDPEHRVMSHFGRCILAAAGALLKAPVPASSRARSHFTLSGPMSVWKNAKCT